MRASLAICLFLSMALPLLAQPTVGEPFVPAIDLAPGERFEPDESSEWEIVQGEAFQVRAFVPGEVTVSGTVVSEDGSSRIVSTVQTIGSVLIDGDTEPSSLADPVSRRPDPTGWVLAGLASMAALLLWLPLFRGRGEPLVAEGGVKLAPRELFLSEIEKARRSPTPLADLADATRRYAFAIDRSLDPSLTSSELLVRADGSRRVPRAALQTVLSAGDLEKFSPWGSEARVEAIASVALSLADGRHGAEGPEVVA